MLLGVTLLAPSWKTNEPVYFGEQQFNRWVVVEEEPFTEIKSGGEIDGYKYAKKLEDFWAVSYDSSCEGCDSVTATGMKQGFGVVAVDPKVIPLYTKVYVPGYGIGIAGDVGGAVKGKVIDLGFDKLEGQWSARWVDVYILE